MNPAENPTMYPIMNPTMCPPIGRRHAPAHPVPVAVGHEYCCQSESIDAAKTAHSMRIEAVPALAAQTTMLTAENRQRLQPNRRSRPMLHSKPGAILRIIGFGALLALAGFVLAGLAPAQAQNTSSGGQN